MKKLILIVLIEIALLFFASATPAEPHPVAHVKNWFVNHPRATKLIYASVAASVHAYGLHHCRLGDVEHCQAGYGSAWISYGSVTALNFLMVPLSEKIGGRAGDLLSYGGSSTQLGFGIYQWRNQKRDNLDAIRFHRP